MVLVKFGNKRKKKIVIREVLETFISTTRLELKGILVKEVELKRKNT